MAKIYVSSTFLDLQEHRAQVEKVIRRMGHEDVAMEYYFAEDTRPVSKCLADVASCDVYVGIFAWRYGWQPMDANPDQLSITEMELRQAEKEGKECLIFLVSDNASWPNTSKDADLSKIKELRTGMSARHLVDYFETSDELGRKIAEAIYHWEKKGQIPEFDRAKYCAALAKRYQRLDLNALTPPQKEEYLQIQLRQVFVEQSVRESPPPIELPKEVWEKLSRDKEIHPEDLPSGITVEDARKARDSYYEKPARLVLDVLTDLHYQHAIILGDPGSGKSTLARYVMLSLIDSTGDERLYRELNSHLPLLVELRSYAGLCAEGNCKTFFEFLEYLGKTEGWHLTQSSLHNYLKNDGRAVVIFDGLDEIFETDKREQITRQIIGFSNDYPKARIIVTCRVIGYRRKILTDAGFTHFTLQDLDEKQVESFVARWYDLAMSDRPDEAKERRERILKSFKESSSIRQLAGNPMLLTIMAIVGKHQELPRERWKLYDHAASVLIEHWDVNKHLKDKSIDADFIGEDDKKELLRRLAFQMQSGKGGLTGNYIYHNQLQAEFEGYLKERYSQTPDRAKVIAEVMIQQFHERNFILSLYGANLYGFVHRAFLEYFCASAFVHKFEKSRELTIRQLKHQVYNVHWEDESWAEVLHLICGMIESQFAGEIIDYLARGINSPWRRWLDKKFFNEVWVHKFEFALSCLSEVRNLNGIEKTTQRILYLIIDLFNSWVRGGSYGYSNNISEIASKIGTNWPRRIILINWLQYLKATSCGVSDGELIGNFIGYVGKGMAEIYKILFDYLNNYNENYRILACFALPAGWNDVSETVGLLRERAVKDNNDEVRSAAIAALAQHYRDDPDTLPLLRERCIKDESWPVRYTAVTTLAQHYSENPDTSPLVRECAVMDEMGIVRSTAVYELGEYFHEDSQTLLLLQDRAINDTDANVRSSAVRALGRYFPNDLQTLPLLRDHAVNDTDAKVRSSAIHALVQYFPEDAQILPLLRDRAANDESPKPDDKKRLWQNDVRKIAIEAIVKHWPMNPDTLQLLQDRAQNDPTPWLRKRAKELITEIEDKNE